MASTYPLNADQVVVRHYWWSDATKAGVNATVAWTPLPFTGSANPNLTDASAMGWVKVASWSTRPDAVSGYMAVPLTASNDPDLTGFVGYRVEPQGETAFTIAVDVNAPTVAADQAMVSALAALTPPVTVTVGQQVKAVWLTDVAQVSPSPTPPSSFYTANQTTDLVVDAVAAHDDDPQAHPDIRALLTDGSGSAASQDYVNNVVAAHSTAQTPHPVYDDLPDLSLLYLNGLV